jgi:PKD repeat protein
LYGSDSSSNLTELACTTDWSGRVTRNLEVGKTYYYQVGTVWWYGGWVAFNLEATPPATAGFGFYPSDPSIFDNIVFWDNSTDPAYIGFEAFLWDFGGGVTATGSSVQHQYTADGDYSVWHKVQTTDGRTAETTQVVQVRTHDVAITKFSPPQSARAGQTKAITVGLRNTRYPETVVVELYKSTPNGFVYVGSLEKAVLVRPSNRTTDFVFNYTFTVEDGLQGKVTFKAIAYIQGYRDALPADNEAIALPTSVRR